MQADHFRLDVAATLARGFHPATIEYLRRRLEARGSDPLPSQQVGCEGAQCRQQNRDNNHQQTARHTADRFDVDLAGTHAAPTTRSASRQPLLHGPFFFSTLHMPGDGRPPNRPQARCRHRRETGL